MFALRAIVLLSSLAVCTLGCRGPAAEAEGSGEPVVVNPVLYLSMSIKAHELDILFNRPNPDSEDIRVTLRGRVHNVGEHDVTSLTVSYDCDFGHPPVKGTAKIGPIAAGESLFVNDVLETFSSPEAGSYRCKVKVESLTV